MFLLRRATISAVLVVVTLWAAGCGDTYRNIITPVTPSGGDPQASHTAVVLSQAVDGSGNPIAGAAISVNTSGDTVSAIAQTGVNPVNVAIVTGGLRALVANKNDGNVTVLNTLLPLNPATTITLPNTPAAQPVFCFAPTSSRGYVALAGRNSVAVLDLSTATFLSEISVGTNPVAMTGFSDGTRVYVANQGSNTVSSVDTSTSTATNIVVGSSPVWVVISSDSSHIYVVNQGSNNISVIRTSDNTVTATVPVGSSPVFAAFDTKEQLLWVANQGSNSVTLIDGSSDTPVVEATIPVGTAPVSIAPLPDGTRTYVANSGDSTVTIVNDLSRTTRTLTVGTNPVSVAASSDSLRVIVANQGSHDISSIQTSNDTVVATIKATQGCVNSPCNYAIPVQVVITP